MIDLGLSKKFRDPQTGIHIPQTTKLSLTGTARYASINAHLGFCNNALKLTMNTEQSRRDDLESVMYVLIYLIKGELPWQGLKAMNKHEKQAQIMDAKMNLPESVLCQNLPSNSFMNN